MKRKLAALLAAFATSASLAQDRPQAPAWTITIHGGAGQIPTDEAFITQRRTVLNKALTHGETLLQSGERSVKVVEEVIRILEDAPEFNAGRGAVFNAAAGHELDASIMDGRSRACGAVAGVRSVRHPISLARHVMTDTRHVLLATDGAEQFADDLGGKIERVANEWFSTDRQRRNLKQAQAMNAVPDNFPFKSG